MTNLKLLKVLTSNSQGKQVQANNFVKFKTYQPTDSVGLTHKGHLSHNDFTSQYEQILLNMKQGQKVQLQLSQNNHQKKIILELIQTKDGQARKHPYQRAEQFKIKGNQQIKLKDYQQAARLYQDGLHLVEYDCSKQAEPVKNSLFSNLTLAFLNIKQYQQCIQMCDKFLSNSLQPNKKIVYRRASANKNIKKWQQAQKDIKFGLQICASDSQGIKDFEQLTEALKKQKKVQDQKQKKVYSKMFA